MTSGGVRIEAAIAGAVASGRAAIAAFVTAGDPTRSRSASILRAVASAADVVEIGVPFSDPVADGPTIQRSSRRALAGGITLAGILADLRAMRSELPAPVVLMSYLNPLLAYGPARLAVDAAAAGVDGLVVPDLPLEEQGLLDSDLRHAGLALIQLVAPTTPAERARELAARSEGFIYAVAVTGITGAAIEDSERIAASIAAIKRRGSVPVLAGFGVRSRSDVARLVPPADGVVVGSALIEAIEAGGDPASFLHGLAR
jgi:tryptophan synthase alpha chain